MVPTRTTSLAKEAVYELFTHHAEEVQRSCGKLFDKEEGVAFVGRLASYKYFNMDQAILNALEMFDNLKETGKLAPKRSPADFGPGDGPK